MTCRHCQDSGWWMRPGTAHGIACNCPVGQGIDRAAVVCQERAELAAQWIPVSERLPASWPPVLVAHHWGAAWFVTIAEYDPSEATGDAEFPWRAADDTGRALDVTHWMPLPGPPG